MLLDDNDDENDDEDDVVKVKYYDKYARFSLFWFIYVQYEYMRISLSLKQATTAAGFFPTPFKDCNGC